MLNKSIFRQIFKATGVYTASNFINTALPFVLLPILTRFLSPQDYGLLATFVAILAIVQIVISLEVSSATAITYFNKELVNFNFSTYVFNAIFINFLFFFIITGLWILLRSFLERAIPIPFNYQLLIPVLGLLFSVCAVSFKLLVVMKKPWPYVSFYSLSTVIEFILSVLFIIVLGAGWRGRVWGIFLSKIIFFVGAIWVLRKFHFFKVAFNQAYIKDILKYSFPVALHSLGFVIIVAIDRFFLNKFTNLSTTGVYSVSYSVCSVIALFTGAFNLASMPFIYEKLQTPTKAMKIKFVQFSYLYFILVIAGVFLFIYIVPHFLNILLGEKFLDAKRFIFWLALGFAFHAMYVMVSRYIFYERKTYILSVIAIATIVLSVVFNYVLIQINGALGVAQATCLVYLFRFLLVWYFSNKVYPMPWFSFAG